jgi:hypothetical protein
MRDPVHYLAVTAFVMLGITLLWRRAAHIAVTTLVAAIGLGCLDVGKHGVDIGVTIYIEDIVCLLLISAAVIAVLRKGQFPHMRSWPAFALSALLAINFARGALEYGLKPAGNDARSFAYFIVPSVAWILLRPATAVNAALVAKWLSAVGCILTIVAVARWSGALAMPQKFIDDLSAEWAQVPERELSRVVTAEYAMLIGQSLLAFAYLQLRYGVRAWRTCVIVILTATIVCLQHRSVWVATLVGLIWLAVASFLASQKHLVQFVSSAGVAWGLTLVALFVFGSTDRLESLIRVNITETQQQSSTWNWRIDGFSEAVDRLFSSSMSEILVGPPSGRDLRLTATQASLYIHSRYVETLAHYGTFGAVVLLIWLFSVARKLGGWLHTPPGQGHEAHAARAILQALLLSQLTYFVAYSGGIAQGALTGLIWIAAECVGTRRNKRIAVARLQRRPSELYTVAPKVTV